MGRSFTAVTTNQGSAEIDASAGVRRDAVQNVGRTTGHRRGRSGLRFALLKNNALLFAPLLRGLSLDSVDGCTHNLTLLRIPKSSLEVLIELCKLGVRRSDAPEDHSSK